VGEFLELSAGDGHKLSAYQAWPQGAPRGGLVVVQEIFGVNRHIRKVADDFAAAGFVALAPALYDRLERGVELGYGEHDFERARALRPQVTFEQALLDVEAAVEASRPAGRVCIVGYCWGGTLAWLAASRIDDLAAASCYYGGIGRFATERPQCLVQLHFGERDQHIPMSEVETVRQAQPAASLYTYPAEHGFNCDERATYHAESARLARERTLALFEKALG
jgi:carboxymethylenebutenolidase